MNTLHEPLILTVAPNGAYKQATDHPALPLSAQQIGQQAKSWLDAGASMLHLHVREPDGRHSLDPQLYREAIAQVRAAVGEQLVLQITSEAAKRYGPHEQMACVRAVRPEAVSVGLREIDQPEVGEQGLAEFLQWLVRERVMTQIILYDVADLRRWQDLCARGLVPQAPWFLLFVLGRYSAGQQSSPHDLLPFVMAHEGQEPWAMCAFGATEQACATVAAALGGHVRVGFENNLLLKDGRTAPDNAALLQQVADVARSLGRPLATAEQLRQRFFQEMNP